MNVSYQCVCGGAATLLAKMDAIRSLLVSHFIISNSDAGNANVSIFLVAPGASPTINNAVIHLVKLSGNTYIEGSGGFVVPPLYSVYAQSTSSNVVVATLSGDLSGE